MPLNTVIREDAPSAWVVTATQVIPFPDAVGWTGVAAVAFLLRT